jgi:hypothetical protein
MKTTNDKREPGVRWNKGKLTGQKRPLEHKDIWAIPVRLQLQSCARSGYVQFRDRLLTVVRAATRSP